MVGISDKRLIEVLSYESEHGADKAKVFFNIKTDDVFRRYRGYARERNLDIPDNVEETKEVSGTSTDIDAFIKEHNIDLEVWEVVSYDIVDGEWDVSAKDRDQDLSWEITRDEDGKAIGQFMEGHSKRGDWDTKKNKKCSIKVRLRKKKEVFDKEKFKRELVESVGIVSPYVSKKAHKKGSHCLEINIFDLHLAKLAWILESGENYDSKIAQKRFFDAIERFIELSSTYKIDKILFPFGNDFFNSDIDYPYPQTTRGTPQQNDLRWQKTFKMGREMIIKATNRLSEIAPVHLIGIPGNHDLQKTFYLGEVLEMRYENDKNVFVDNLPKTRKYFNYGKNLIGLTHGDNEPLARLLLLMPQEVPELWAKTKYREWHCGHHHHAKKVSTISSEDNQGITVKYMKSLKGTDAWEYRKGFIGSIGGAEAFIWHKDDGLIGSFNYNL